VLGSIVGYQPVILNAPTIFSAVVNPALIDEVHRTLIKVIITLKRGERNFVFIKDAMPCHHAMEGGSITHLSSSTGYWSFRGRFTMMGGGIPK
jgi:hypothetical protein